MKWLLSLFLLICINVSAQTPFKGTDYMFYYQVNIGKTNGSLTIPSAWLEIGKDSTTKGIRMPRVVDTVNISSPVFGLMVYQIKDNGIYFRDKIAWKKISDGSEINGTANFLVKFGPTGRTLTNSQVFDNGTNVGIGTNTPIAKLHVNGGLKVDGNADITSIASITGTSTAANNIAVSQYRKSNLLRTGYVGDAASFDNKMYVVGLNGADIRFSGYTGDDAVTPPPMSALFTNSGRFVFGDSVLTGTAILRVKGSAQMDSLSLGVATPQERLHVNGNIIANTPAYVSGGILGVGRNQTTGRFESYVLPGAGTVTSVGLSMPSIFNVSGSPVTNSGTLTASLANQLNNLVLASPNGSTGVPTFRSLTNSDFPTSGVSSGTYGSDSTSAVITVNSQGIVTNASQIQIKYSGTVKSVGLSLPSIFTTSGTPVTTTGTLTGTLAAQSANLIFSGPVGGGPATPTFRALVPADIPGIDAGKIITGTIPTSRGGTGLSTLGTSLQQLRVNAGGTALEYYTPPTTSGAINSVIYGDGTYTLSATDGYVTVNGTANNTVTFNAPSATGNAGKIIFVVKMSGFSYILSGTTINARMVILVCDGTNWLLNLFV